MRKFLILLMTTLLMSCSCVRRFPDPDGSDVRDAISQTVKIFVQIDGTKITNGKDGDAVRESYTLKWSGSGVVVAIDARYADGKSLVMTAAHVSNVPMFKMMIDDNDNKSLFVLEKEKIVIETLEGHICNGKQLKADVEHDVSVVEVDCIAGTKAELADELPPIGAIIMTSGAPFGYHPEGMFIPSEGRFAGIDLSDKDNEIFTIPVAPGHSGSGIFYQGRLIGIVSAHNTEYEHMTKGPHLKYLKEVLKLALGEWK